ncbi:MAG TPA: glycosyltransferase family 9 protein [Candidatus Paceibacterota bacterium]|nr:glycosyltransferase family 9 protein [Candidatus Paceibacterota bacterium]
MLFTLKKLALLALVALHGPARRCPERPQRVIVVQQAKLGDMICTTPVFAALKRTYTDLHLAVMGNRVNEDVLRGNPHVDRYLVFTDFRSALKEVRKGGFDTGIVTGPDFVSIALLILAGVGCVIAPSIEKGVTPLANSLYRSLLRFVVSLPHEEGTYAPGQYLRLLEPLGIHTTDTTKVLAYTPSAHATAATYLKSIGERPKLLVGMTPSAGNTVKEWPPERFAAIADHLISTYGAKVIVLGTKAERSKIDAMLEQVKEKQDVIDAGGRFDIEELKALIAALDLFIAADTGPMYIAEAFKVPTVDIVGPVDERIQPPQGPLHRVVIPPRSRPAQVTVLNAKWYDREEARKQAEATTVAAVIREVDDLIASMK